MNCPACARRLEERTFDDLRLDVCARGCGGVWFDQFEFRKFDLRFITPSYYIPDDQEWGAY